MSPVIIETVATNEPQLHCALFWWKSRGFCRARPNSADQAFF
jgi:hypothetical protein